MTTPNSAPQYTSILEREPTLSECHECGALCIDTNKHAAWHRRVTSASMASADWFGL